MGFNWISRKRTKTSRGKLTKVRNVQLPAVRIYSRCGVHGAVFCDIASMACTLVSTTECIISTTEVIWLATWQRLPHLILNQMDMKLTDVTVGVIYDLVLIDSADISETSKPSCIHIFSSSPLLTMHCPQSHQSCSHAKQFVHELIMSQPSLSCRMF